MPSAVKHLDRITVNYNGQEAGEKIDLFGKLVLVNLDGKTVSKQKDFPLYYKEIVIGRDSRSTLQIIHPIVSRQHCTIKYQDDGPRLVNQSSLNFTFVNGNQVTGEVPLRYGDSIKVGPQELLFETCQEPLVASEVVIKNPQNGKNGKATEMIDNQNGHGCQEDTSDANLVESNEDCSSPTSKENKRESTEHEITFQDPISLEERKFENADDQIQEAHHDTIVKDQSQIGTDNGQEVEDEEAGAAKVVVEFQNLDTTGVELEFPSLDNVAELQNDWKEESNVDEHPDDSKEKFNIDQYQNGSKEEASVNEHQNDSEEKSNIDGENEKQNETSYQDSNIAESDAIPTDRALSFHSNNESMDEEKIECEVIQKQDNDESIGGGEVESQVIDEKTVLPYESKSEENGEQVEIGIDQQNNIDDSQENEEDESQVIVEGIVYSHQSEDKEKIESEIIPKGDNDESKEGEEMEIPASNQESFQDSKSEEEFKKPGQSMLNMIIEALQHMNDLKGSSTQAIKKYISTVHSIEIKNVKDEFNECLKEAVENGTLVQTRGRGATGSFKLNVKQPSQLEGASKIEDETEKSEEEAQETVREEKEENSKPCPLASSMRKTRQKLGRTRREQLKVTFQVSEDPTEDSTPEKQSKSKSSDKSSPETSPVKTRRKSIDTSSKPSPVKKTEKSEIDPIETSPAKRSKKVAAKSSRNSPVKRSKKSGDNALKSSPAKKSSKLDNNQPETSPAKTRQKTTESSPKRSPVKRVKKTETEPIETSPEPVKRTRRSFESSIKSPSVTRGKRSAKATSETAAKKSPTSLAGGGDRDAPTQSKRTTRSQKNVEKQPKVPKEEAKPKKATAKPIAAIRTRSR